MQLIKASKILIIDMRHIGDLLFITPMLHLLRQANPAAQIDVMVNAPNKDVLLYNPRINHILTYDKRGSEKGLAGFWRTVKKLRSRQYDVVFNLQPYERSTTLAAFSGADCKITVTYGFNGLKTTVATGSRLLWPLFDRLLTCRQDLHIVDMHVELLAQLGVPTNGEICLNLWESDDSRIFAQQMLAEQWGTVPSQTLVGINIGGTWKTKVWTAEKFAAVACNLWNNGCRVVFFGGPKDTHFMNTIRATLDIPFINLVGKTSLLELAACIGCCHVLISGDSGALHMGAAKGVPCVALFGSTSPAFSYPYGTRHRCITTGLECSPCFLSKCRQSKGSIPCMEKISVNQVIEAVQELRKQG